MPYNYHNNNNTNKNNNSNINCNHNTTQKMEGRLRFRKNNDTSQLKQLELLEDRCNEKETTEDDETTPDDGSATITKRNCCKRAASTNNDDSLADFKLPKLISKPHPLNNKIKLLNDKSSSPSSSLSSSTSSRGGKKRQLKRRKSIDTSEKNQPSIESSFFKPPTAFVCPLCFKKFNDINAQSIHSKNCASKYNVSTKKLLAAVELQERQAEERLAIGLPAAPFQQAKRKTFNTKKMAFEGDPDIQLAIALSKSLSEMESREHFDEALALAAESNDDILQMSSSQRKSTLQNFGFVTNKPIVETVSEKTRRKKKFSTTILQTRTQETRERLLSDKIGEILVGNEPITQLQLDEGKVDMDKNIIGDFSLRSDLLKQIYKPNMDLWNQSFNIKQRSTYYVEDLSEFISPIDETETNLNDKNNDEDEIIVEKSSIDEEIVDKLNNVEDESSDIELELEKKQLGDEIVSKTKSDSLASSWSKMLNSNAYSDVIINVKNSKYIYCHEIVLWTRCQSIQKDLVITSDNLHDKQHKRIQWLDINFPSAIAFLEFIYCGEINFEQLESDENLLYEVYMLAEKYKVNELLKHLDENIVIVKKKAENKLICEDREVDFTSEIESDRSNEATNSRENSESSINRSEFNAPMSNEDNESIVDGEAKDFTTEIDNGHCNEEINLLNSPEWLINRSDLNAKILEEKDESILDGGEIECTTEIEFEHCNSGISSSRSPKLSRKPSKSIAQEVENKISSQLSNKSPNVSCQLHYSRISTSPDMFEDMEMSYNCLMSTGKKLNINETNVNSNENALDVLVELVNENLSSRSSEKEDIDDYFDMKLTQTPKRYSRLSSTCPVNSTTSKMASDDKNRGNLRLSSTIIETKSNMSLFIEKIQKNNAKGMLDSDSDSEITIPELKKFRRNPFRVRKSDEDSLLVAKYNCCDLENEENSLLNSCEGDKEKKSALSLFEEEIRARVANNRDKFIASQDKNGESVDVELLNDEDEEGDNEESSNAETDEENVSIYTKYKRTHQNNSIGNYRSILKSFMQKNIEENNTRDNIEEFNSEDGKKIYTSSDDSEDENEDMEKNTTKKHEISAINKIRLAELSAFDIYEAMSPSPLNSSLDDSTTTKSSLSPKSPIDLTVSDHVSGDENSDKPSTNKCPYDNETSQNVDNTLNDKSDKVNSFECANVDGLEFGNWSGEISGVNDWQPLTQGNLKPKSPDKNPQASEDKQNHLSQLSLSELKSIDLTQSDDEGNPEVQTQNSTTNQLCDTVTENITRILKECGALDSTIININSKSLQNIDNSAPIVLSSSSETECVDINTYNYPKNLISNVGNDNFDEFPIESDLENNFMEFVIEGGAETPHSTPYWNDFQQPSTSGLCINDQNVTIRSRKSNNLTYNSYQRSIDDISSISDEVLPQISGNTPSPKRSRWSSVSPQKNKSSTRLLTTKSRSEGNFTSHERRSVNQEDEFIRPTKQLLSYLNLSSDNCGISFDVPPRENYSAMSSPELNERLAKYGLRNQKRHRAVKLLNFIYDQMYPMVPAYLVALQRKKNLSLMIDRNIESNDDKLNRAHPESDNESTDSSISNSSAIALEMIQLPDDDEEYDEKDVIYLRDSFQRLLKTDQVLHDKILKYEPVSLATIHEKLKKTGIQSGPKLLADYLDCECISFYVECPKKRRRQNKKPKKKRKEK